MTTSTSQAFYDHVLSLFLYGEDTTPTQVADEQYLPPLRRIVSNVSVDATDFMQGPGRFASPVFFELVQRFFESDYAQIFNAVRASGKSYFIDSLVAISKGDLLDVLGISIGSLAFNQAYFDDGQDDYASRVFFWSSTAFQISKDAIFVFGPDDTREIRNFAVEPLRSGSGQGGYAKDNFDWAGGSLAELAEPFVRPKIDPFGIGDDVQDGGGAASGYRGRDVDIFFSGSVSGRVTYTRSSYDQDVANAPTSVGGSDLTSGTSAGRPATSLIDDGAAGLKLQAGGDAFVRDLYQRGVVRYEQDGYNVFYGTRENNVIALDGDPASLALTYPHLSFARSAAKGAWVIGGDGIDLIRGFTKLENRLTGGDGDDSLFGGDVADRIYGDAGRDRLSGGSGDDMLFADADDALIDGGGGNDTVDYSDSANAIDWAAANTGVKGVERVIGSDHDDRLELATSILGPLVDSSVTIDGGDGDDRLGGNDAANTLNGESGDDTIKGEGGGDTIDGGSGDDTVAGGAGDDRISGDVGDDRLVGGDGTDTIFGGEGNDTINGEAGDDTLNGDGGNDRILGADGGDTIDGGAGNDILIGAGGKDSLRGGAGNDILDAAQDDSPLIGSNRDDLWGGGGNDVFLTNNGDTIHDIDSGDRVKLGEAFLNGGERKAPPPNPCAPSPDMPESPDGTYKAADGTKYDLSGSTLTVTSPPGLLGTLFSSTITIEGFRNGEAGIRLKNARPDIRQAECNRDPLIIDLNGDRNVVRELYDSYAYFDLDNDGFREHVAWTLGGDGLLVVDRNGNGTIDDGTELFGSGRIDFNQPTNRAGTDGFAELAAYDSNHDGKVSAADANFAALRVWIDANGDGETDAGELKTLDELNIASIGLATRASDDQDCGCDGTDVTATATVTRSDGSTTGIYDAYLSIDQYDTREANPVAVSATLAGLPFLLGTGTLSDLDVAMTRDPALEALVREFAALTTTDAAKVPELVERIILRWTGADTVAPDARGVSINARWLAALEQVSGSGFAQFAIGRNPRADAAAILNGEWQDLVAITTSQLLGQTTLGAAILPGLSFAGAAFHQVAPGTTLASVIAAAAATAPIAAAAALPYWKAVIDGATPYLAQLGVSKTQLGAAIDAAAPAGSLPVHASELISAFLIGGAGGGVGVGTSEFARVTFRITGDDLLVALPGATELVGAGGNDRYLVSKSLGRITLSESGGAQDVLMLYDWQRAATTVQTSVGSFTRSNDLGAIYAELSIRITTGQSAEVAFDGTFVAGRLQLGIETISFADGVEIDLLDLLPPTIALPGGGTIVVGASGSAATVTGGAGDDLLLGRSAADSYRLAAGSGADLIVDTASTASTGDILRISANFPAVTFEIVGQALKDLGVRLATGESVIIFDQWAGTGAAIDSFEFADGSRLTATALQTRLTTGTAADDVITGSYADDVIDGRGGTDIARGGHGDDVYRFAKGGGSLTVNDLEGLSTLELSGTTLDKVRLQVTGDGLVVRIEGSDDIVRFAGNRDGDNVVLRAGGLEKSAHDILFAQALLAGTTTNGTLYGTQGDDDLRGTDAAEQIDGMAGHDTLSGGLGNDTYLFSVGHKRINDTGFGNDTLLIGGGYTIDDIILTTTESTYGGIRVRIAGTDARADLGNRFVTSTGAADNNMSDDIETIRFADGRTIDIGHGKQLTGTSGNDVLFSYGTGGDIFLPGAGNDRIFALNGAHSVTETAGFGHDVFYPAYNAAIRFQGIALDNHVGITRSGYDLIVTANDGVDSFTMVGAFKPLQENTLRYLAFDNALLSADEVAARIAVATDGNDVLFGRTALDGGKGDDVLIGSSRPNDYRFGRGWGDDVIKEQDSTSGYGPDDTLTLVGLNRADVSFSRHPTDPTSIVITIRDTGETLTIDGTPFDDFVYSSEDSLGDGYPKGDQSGAHRIETILFADGSTLTGRALEQAIIDGERTAGSDTITNFGAPRNSYDPDAGALLDGGAGNDLYLNDYHDVLVAFAPGGGQDVLRNRGDNPTVHVQLVGFDTDDVVVRFETRDDTPYTILRAKDGSELAIEGQSSTVRPVNVYIFDPNGESYFAGFEGGLVPSLAGTAGIDYLVGSGDGGGEVGLPTPRSETFTPGKGDDVIAGRGGEDTIVFARGDGADFLLPTSGFGGGFGGGFEGFGPGDFEETGYIVAFGAGISASDLSIAWLADGSSNIRISVGSGDSITVDAREILGLTFANGDQVSFGESTILLSSGDSSSGTDGDDTFLAPDGGAFIAVPSGSGADILRDGYLSSYTSGDPIPAGWQPNSVLLDSGDGLSGYEFIRDADHRANLVIRHIASGATLTVEGQFAAGAATGPAWSQIDRDGNGSPDWAQVDTDGDGVGDFGKLDTDGDAIPNWLAPDFDGDGQSDWSLYVAKSLDIDGDGNPDIYANDSDDDGIVDVFAILDATIGTGGIAFRDTDGDNDPDQYSTNYFGFGTTPTWIDVPRTAGGAKNWAAVDTNQDGKGDAFLLDTDADGTPNWQSPDRNHDGQSDWRNDSVEELSNAAGDYVAARKTIGGVMHYDIAQYLPGRGELVARDTNGDGIPDQYGFDRDGDFVADPVLPPVAVESFLVRVNTANGSTLQFLDWEDILGRVVEQTVEGGDGPVVIDLFALRPMPTAGADVLIAEAYTTIDGLGGDDRIITVDGNVTVRFGVGSGNDVLVGTAQIGQNRDDTLQFKGIASLSQLQFLRSGDDDLVVRIVATGETLTIRHQLAVDGDGSSRPVVTSFTLDGGATVAWKTIVGFVNGAAAEGGSTITTGAGGGVLDGGAGTDLLRGGVGNDVYRFGRGYGDDVVRDAGGADTVVFASGITADAVYFSRTGNGGNDLLVEITGVDRQSMLITGQFADPAARIESFQFADGTVLNWRDAQRFILDVTATSADDVIVGFATADRIASGGGNDSITGGAGDDSIDGGAGRDTATFRGARADYVITTAAGITTVRDTTVGRDGTDTLVNVEDLRFLGGGGSVFALVAANRAPVVGAFTVSGIEDIDIVIRRADVLANVSDADGDVVLLTGVDAATGGAAWIDAAGDVHFRGIANFTGSTGFDYAVSDGNGGTASGRVTVTIAPANDAPVVVAGIDTIIVDEDRPIDALLPATLFSDPDGNPLTLSFGVAGGGALPAWLSVANGRLIGQPPADFNGTQAFEARASDGIATSRIAFDLVVRPVNDAPRLASAIDDATVIAGTVVAIAIPAHFFDVDGDALQYTVRRADGSVLPAWLSFDGTTLRGTVPADFAGSLSMVATASDGTALTSASFAIVAGAANYAPVVAAPLTAISVAEDGSIDVTIPPGTFTDADGDTLTLTAKLGDGTALPAWLSFANGRFTGTPPANFNGSIALAVTASDGLASTTSTFDLIVTPVNDAPTVAIPLATVSVAEDTPVNILIPAGTFADVDSDALTLTAKLGDGSALPAWLSFANGHFTGTPPANFNGSIALAVTASDSSTSVTSTFNLIVTPVNDAPVVMVPLPAVTVAEDSAIDFTIPAGTFADVDGNALTLSAKLGDGTALPAWLTFAGGRFTGTPPANFNGTVPIAVTASDAQLSATSTFNLVISPVNDAPIVAHPIADVTSTSTTVSVVIPADAFSDVDRDALAYSVTLANGSALPSWLSFNAATRTLSGTAPNGGTSIALKVAASDGALSASDIFQLTTPAVAAGGGSTTGFVLTNVNSWYNPSYGGGAIIEFRYTVQSEAIQDGALKAIEILANYVGAGHITGGWLNSYNGSIRTTVFDNGHGFRFDNLSQSYQPNLQAGQSFTIAIQIDGAGYTANDLRFTIFDRDTQPNLADASDAVIRGNTAHGSNGQITDSLTIANTSQVAIDNWSVLLDVPNGVTLTLTNVWGATATVQANGDIRFTALDWNDAIAVGGESSFGFNATYSGGAIDIPASSFGF